MSDRTRDLLLPITILISVAVGAVIGGSLARSGDMGPSPVNATRAESKAFLDGMDALRAELARTREQFALTASSPPSSPLSETRSVAPDMSAEMRAATARLVDAAESLRTAASHVGGDRAPLVPPAVVDPKAMQDVINQEREVNDKAYRLWTYQQVMDRFGPPDYVGREEGGVVWMYNAKPRPVFFDFVDGRVISVRN